MVKAELRRALGDVRRKVIGLRPRNETPFATHMPVLIALGGQRPIRRVLEFGSGTFSSLLFLNRTAFPDVTEVVSFEDDRAWADEVTAGANGDPRLSLHVVDSVPDSVPSAIDGFDLVLIDDSVSVELRSRTIAAVGQRRPAAPVVIHDFELKGYGDAAVGFEHVEVVRAFNPQAAIAWFGDVVAAADVERLRRSLDANRNIPVTDVDAWIRALRG